jgi:hypothetical protein
MLDYMYSMLDYMYSKLDYMYSMVDCVLQGRRGGRRTGRIRQRTVRGRPQTGRIRRRTGRGSEGAAPKVMRGYRAAAPLNRVQPRGKRRVLFLAGGRPPATRGWPC